MWTTVELSLDGKVWTSPPAAATIIQTGGKPYSSKIYVTFRCREAASDALDCSLKAYKNPGGAIFIKWLGTDDKKCGNEGIILNTSAYAGLPLPGGFDVVIVVPEIRGMENDTS